MAFWEDKSLGELNDEEWEALCDGCARCCMIKLEDEDDGSIHYTGLVCDLLDTNRCRCTRYPERHKLVKDCIDFDADLVSTLRWLPVTCGYRRVAEGKGLLPWHPLISGSAESVHEAQISVRDRVIPVRMVHEDEYQEHIVDWVET